MTEDRPVRWMVSFQHPDGDSAEELEFPNVEPWYLDEQTSRAEASRVLIGLREERGDERDWVATGHPVPLEGGDGSHSGGQWNMRYRDAKRGVITSEIASLATDDEKAGLETELEDPQEQITDPFNPEQIKIRTVNIVVEQLVSRIKYGEIDLSPDFQRLRGIWTNGQKSRLIESLLLRIPLPVFYVASDESDAWSVVDGVQRMSTIFDFVTGSLRLTGLQYLSQLEGHWHDDLPRQLQRRISETQLIINVIEPGIPPAVTFNVFLRINTGGMPLNGQEIRHALNPGPARTFLEDLALSEEFIASTDGSIAVHRMADRECVLRFLAFHVNGWGGYSSNDLDGYLVRGMRAVNEMTDAERRILATDFKKAMLAAFDLFGKNAFRKMASGRRGRVNRALLEAWSVQLARCSPEQIAILVEHREDVLRGFENLLYDGEFEQSITYSTNAPWRVHKRFEAIGNLIKETIECYETSS